MINGKAQDLYMKVVDVQEKISEGRPNQWELKIHWPWIPDDWKPETVWLDQSVHPEQPKLGTYAVRAEPGATKRNTKNPADPYDGSQEWMSFWRVVEMNEYMGNGPTPAAERTDTKMALPPLPKEISIERQVSLKCAVDYAMNGLDDNLKRDPRLVVRIAEMFAAFLRGDENASNMNFEVLK